MDNSINLKDISFLVVVRLDSIERLENILGITQFLSSNLETNIWVSEYSSYNNGLLKKLLNKRIIYTFNEDHDPILYRTKYLNQMIGAINKPYVAIWDADVIVPIDQIVLAAELLREGKADFVYPYESHFFDTTPILRKFYLKEKKIEILEQNKNKMKEMYLPNPVGGTFFANLNVYKESGLENESFYGWGLEDGERYSRWMNMGYKIHRVNGPLFHLTHPRGTNSGFHNDDQFLLKKREIKSVRRNTSVSCAHSNDEQPDN